MKPYDVATLLLPSKKNPVKENGVAYAPSNIALAKYWGKRNTTLNLPLTSSLSISLGNKGTSTTVSISPIERDMFFLNTKEITEHNNFFQRLSQYLNIFRPHPHFYFKIETINTIPIAAGLASSASGFAALTLALNDFFGWELENKALSILARLGSGSAARSLWNGFVQWNAGTSDDGMDSFAEKLPYTWPELRVGLLIVSSSEKSLSSREAMQRCQETSPFYQMWPAHVAHTIDSLQQALIQKDLRVLGLAAEQNALAMHSTMHTSNPAFSYWQADTLSAMQKVWLLRQKEVPLYFTEDAGPNLKLLFTEETTAQVLDQFPTVEIIKPFEYSA